MKGYDISHYNTATPDADFIIIKATEGKTLPDSMLDAHARRAWDNGSITGFYHYAHAENNSPEAEAEFFIMNIRRYIGRCFVALDFEGKSLTIRNKDAWAMAFLDTVKRKTGLTGFLYISYGERGKFVKTLTKYPAWFARWGNTEPAGASIWQYSSLGIDKDTTRMTRGELEKYTKPDAETMTDKIAREVIAGKWGNGAERKKKITAAGYNYKMIQDMVNEIMAYTE